MNVKHVVVLAGRIAALEKQLEEAKAELVREVGRPAPVAREKTSATSVSRKRTVVSSGLSISDQVRKELAKGPASFGDLRGRLGANPGTLKSILKKERERGAAQFLGGLYQLPKAKKPRSPRSEGAQPQLTA